MNYNIVYEAQPSIGISIPYAIVVVLTVGIIILFIRNWKSQKLASRIGMSFVVLVLLIIHFSLIYSAIDARRQVYDAFMNGRYSIVEGTVGDYVEIADHPPADRFVVKGIDFEVPGFLTVWGYPIRKGDGGALDDGVNVRIEYIRYKFENVIMKLEIANGKQP